MRSNRAIIAMLIIAGALLAAGSGLIADLSGSFADPDRQFDAVHDSQSAGVRFIIGGALLAAGALASVPAFGTMVLRRAAAPSWDLRHLCAFAFLVLFAALMMGSAAAYATVSASRELGDAFDDDGQFATGAWVLPQFATLLYICASAAGAAFMISVAASLEARERARVSLWVGAAVASLLVLVSFAMPPLIALLPLWLVAAALFSAPAPARGTRS